MDGTVVEQLTGIDYVRAANTHAKEIERVERTAEGRRSGRSGTISRCRCSARARR